MIEKSISLVRMARNNSQLGRVYEVPPGLSRTQKIIYVKVKYILETRRIPIGFKYEVL